MYIHSVIISALQMAIVVTAMPSNILPRDVDSSKIVGFGIQAGQDPQPDGTCAGDNGVRIPCNCPPDFGTYSATLNQFVTTGSPVTSFSPNGILPWPTGESGADYVARLQSQLVALQNAGGRGVGCPVTSTTWNEVMQFYRIVCNEQGATC